MEFKRENPSARFSVPDKITVRQQLHYFSESRSPSIPVFERLWLGAVTLITEWECELMPDFKTDLDGVENPEITKILTWAGIEVMNYIESLGSAEKNL